eukprot:183191_1
MECKAGKCTDHFITGCMCMVRMIDDVCCHQMAKPSVFCVLYLIYIFLCVDTDTNVCINLSMIINKLTRNIKYTNTCSLQHQCKPFRAIHDCSTSFLNLSFQINRIDSNVNMIGLSTIKPRYNRFL